MKTKKKTKRPYRFKGFDWMELANYWGIEGDEAAAKAYEKEHPGEYFDAEAECFLPGIRKIMLDARVEGGTKLKEVAGVIRKFLKALARCGETVDYHNPVWKGMLAIKNDSGGNETLLKFTDILLESMWT